MYPILSQIRSRMASQCPLCLLMTRGGGLCEGCLADAQALNRSGGQCVQCGDAMPPVVDGGRCKACLSIPPAFVQTVFAFEYAYPLDILISDFKEQGRLGYAQMFGDMLWRAMQAQLSRTIRLERLVPVPAGSSALVRRGFNPAGEVARALARISGLRCATDWLVRTRESRAQKEMSQSQRRLNVQGLYQSDRPLPAVWVGLVDDVMTTGSTMQACAQAMLRAGVAGVVALAVARTPQVWQNAPYVSCHSGPARNPPEHR